MENGGGLDFHCPNVGFKCLVSASKSSREWLSVSAQAQDRQLATSEVKKVSMQDEEEEV